MTDEFRQRLADGETLDDLLPEAFAVGPRGGQAHARPAPLRRPDHGRRRAAPRQHRRDEDRRGQDPGLDAAGLPQRARRQGRPRRHGQRLPRRARRRVDGPGAPLPRPRGRRDPGQRCGPSERRRQYACDITYGTNNEFGFDYLRDNMAWTPRRAGPARPQLRDRRRGRLDPHRRGPHAADHQRPGRPGRPSGTPSSPGIVPAAASRTSTTRSTRRSAPSASSSRGVEKVEDQLGIDNLYESVNTPLVGYLNNALKAKELFKRDKDYVVMNGEVLIVDEHTGRILPAAATTRACTRRSRPRKAWRSRTRTRPSPRSPCRTTSASTTSSPA